jgi:hypothetical protein
MPIAQPGLGLQAYFLLDPSLLSELEELPLTE